MASRTIVDVAERSRCVRRRAQFTMMGVFGAFALLGAARLAVDGRWPPAGLIAGVAILACLGLCVFTAVYDERAWRGVERDLENLRRSRGRGDCAETPRGP